MDRTSKDSKASPDWTERIRSAGAGRQSAHEQLDANKRWGRRKKSDIPAQIYASGQQTAIRCSVRDTSSTGALIQMRPDSSNMTVDDLPETFTLVTKTYRDYTEVKCSIVRRFGDCVGIRYTSQFRTVAQQKRTLGTKRK